MKINGCLKKNAHRADNRLEENYPLGTQLGWADKELRCLSSNEHFLK